MEPDLLALMFHTVTVEPFTGRDEYGRPTYGAATQYRARVVGMQRLVRTPDGAEKVSATTVYLASAPGVGPEDRVTLPDGSQPPILVVSRMPDDRGWHHEVVYCG